MTQKVNIMYKDMNDSMWEKSSYTEAEFKRDIRLGKMIRVDGYYNVENGLIYKVIEDEN